jgi:magnesium transporter
MELRIFSDLHEFSKSVEESGFRFDFQSLRELTSTFMDYSEQHIVLSIKDYDLDDPDKILFLSEQKAFLYSKKPPPKQLFDSFSKLQTRPYGSSTILFFTVVDGIELSYKRRLDAIIASMRELETHYTVRRYHDLTIELERLADRLEDLLDIIIRVKERSIKIIQTKYISFDYSVLTAEVNTLLDRCRNRFNMLREIARDHQLQAANDLNRRMEKLSEVVRKLTALTIILMVPTVLTSHFGMNFAFMPELRVWYAYPIVVVAQIVSVVTAIVVFRRIKWL